MHYKLSLGRWLSLCPEPARLQHEQRCWVPPTSHQRGNSQVILHQHKCNRQGSMAQPFMSYQRNDFGERGLWIKLHSSETETLKSVQVHQLIVNPCGVKSYGTRQFAQFGLMESVGQTWIPEVLWDSGQWYLPGGGDPPAELPAVAEEPCGAPSSLPAHWDTDRDAALVLMLCWQTPAGLWKLRHPLSSSPGHPPAPYPPSLCSLPMSFPSPHFSLGDPRAATSATSAASLWSWLIPAEKPAWVWAGSTHVPASGLPPP